MDILLLLKLLAGLAIFLVALVAIFFISISIWTEWTSWKRCIKRRDLKELKPKIRFWFGVAAIVLAFSAIVYSCPLLAFIIWLVWFVTRGHKTMCLFGEPTKGISLTRQRMEELRKANSAPETPLTKSEKLKLREAKKKQNFNNLLSKVAQRSASYKSR